MSNCKLPAMIQGGLNACFPESESGVDRATHALAASPSGDSPPARDPLEVHFRKALRERLLQVCLGVPVHGRWARSSDCQSWDGRPGPF